jgi:prepilin-type N-terminal cleavage/methylation domain-containing protein/prepilin-type processing-associated H-X9-DG protein
VCGQWLALNINDRLPVINHDYSFHQAHGGGGWRHHVGVASPKEDFFTMNRSKSLFSRGHLRHGFTLVEVLVVVGIVGLLAVLTVPSVARAREYAKRIKCLHNMHQMAVCMQAAADDNNGVYPNYLYDVETSSSGTTVFYTLNIKSGWTSHDLGLNVPVDILLCPSDDNPSIINTTGANGSPITIASSYGYNVELLFQLNGSKISNPESTVLLFDGKPDKIQGYWTGEPGLTLAENTTPPAATPATVVPESIFEVENPAIATGSALMVMLAPGPMAPSNPPNINQHPNSQTVTVGANVTFNVNATGSNPKTYQWRYNGTNIAGATNQSYTISNVQLAHAGDYSVVVSNAFGSDTSNSASLTVNAPLVAPAIVTQPAPQTVTSGANVSFSVTATGSSPLTYQWRFNGSNINNATNSTYSVSNTQQSHAGQYSVRVSNAAGNVISTNAELTVNNIPGSNGPTDCVPPAGHTKTLICHVPPGDPDNGTTLSVGWPSMDGHANHSNDECGPCKGGDIKLINNQIAARRHLGQMNVIYADGHGQWLDNISADAIYP